MSDSTESSGAGAPAWMATYSDTMTLLMTFFILLMTFSTTSPFKNLHREHSLIGGKGKTGKAGEPTRGMEMPGLVIRDYSLMNPPQSVGPRAKARHGPEVIPEERFSLALPEENPSGDFTHTYALRLSTRATFSTDTSLSTTGRTILAGLATRMRHLPYDLIVEVSHPNDLDKAWVATDYLYRQHRIHPGRLGISVRSGPQSSPHAFWLRLARTRSEPES